MMGGALPEVGERAEQEEEERGLLTGQSSRRTHTSSGLLEMPRPADESPLLLLVFLHVPFERIELSSSLRPFSLDSEDADSTDEELPVLFHVPTRGKDVECLPALPPPAPVLLFSRFQVPVRLKRDEVASCGRDGLSEWERLTSCLLLVDGRKMSGLVGDSDGAAGADSSSFLFSVGLGASLINVDWRTRAGFSGSVFCFLATAAPPTLDADSLLGIPLVPVLPFVIPLCFAALEADDEDEDADALPGDAARGSCDSFPPFWIFTLEERDGVESREDAPPWSAASLFPGGLATAAALGLLRPLAAGSALILPVMRLLYTFLPPLTPLASSSSSSFLASSVVRSPALRIRAPRFTGTSSASSTLSSSALLLADGR